jgi:hypothetical protein
LSTANFRKPSPSHGVVENYFNNTTSSKYETASNFLRTHLKGDLNDDIMQKMSSSLERTRDL